MALGETTPKLCLISWEIMRKDCPHKLFGVPNSHLWPSFCKTQRGIKTDGFQDGRLGRQNPGPFLGTTQERSPLCGTFWTQIWLKVVYSVPQKRPGLWHLNKLFDVWKLGSLVPVCFGPRLGVSLAVPKGVWKRMGIKMASFFEKLTFWCPLVLVPRYFGTRLGASKYFVSFSFRTQYHAKLEDQS